MNNFSIKKISILGPNGSGKSYLADELGKLLCLPLSGIIHLDDYLHRSDKKWENTDREQYAEELIKEKVQMPSWIIEGGYVHYPKVLETRFQCADATILLNFSQKTCMDGIIERDKKISPEHITRLKSYMERFELHKPKIVELKNKYPNKQFLEFSNRQEVNDFLKCLIQSTARTTTNNNG